MSDVLCIEPGHGSTWLSNVEIVQTDDGPYVVGEVWDDSGVGSPYMPDDYMGEPATMNYPARWVIKDPDGVLTQLETKGA